MENKELSKKAKEISSTPEIKKVVSDLIKEVERLEVLADKAERIIFYGWKGIFNNQNK